MRAERTYPSDWIWVAALIFFASGALCGSLLTALPRLTLDNWLYWAGGRIVWQLGGAVWFGAAICDPLGEPRRKGATLGLLLGLVLCFNPVLDVVRGPQVLEGAVTGVWVSRGPIWRESGAYSPTIHARVEVETAEGTRRLDLHGRQANLWAGRFEACREREDAVQAVVLRHLDAVLDLECLP